MLYNTNQSPSKQSKYNVFSSTALNLKEKNTILPQNDKKNRVNDIKEKLNLNQIKLRLISVQQKLREKKMMTVSPQSALYTHYQKSQQIQGISPTKTQIPTKTRNHINLAHQNLLIKSWCSKQVPFAKNNEQKSIIKPKNNSSDFFYLIQSIKEPNNPKTLKASLSNNRIALSKSVIINDQQQLKESNQLAQSIQFLSDQIKKKKEKNQEKEDQEKIQFKNKKERHQNNIMKSMQMLEFYQSLRMNTKKQKEIQQEKKIIINGFGLIRMIGKGKFSKVYLAKHEQTGFLVALKIIQKKKIKQYNLQKQFAKEIRLHSSLDHPHIVKFYGFFEHKEDIYLVLEYVNNGTLFNRLKSVGHLGVKQTVDYLKDILSAIQYIHDRCIAHRDLKPENVVLAIEGVAKLCDFGWASIIYEPRKTYCGTLQYASPQVLSRKSYGLQVDIWSLGILIYEMLIGHAPFGHKDKEITKSNIINSDKVQFSYSANVPQEAKQLIEILVQKDSSKRYKIKQILQHKFLTKHYKK